MSTMTMLDSFDAQMTDYPTDMDVPMNSNTDAWFQEEAPMEADGNYPSPEKPMYTDQENTIEVDMEAFEEEQHIEYEMTDGAETFAAVAAEIPDVEVYDASIMHTPVVPSVQDFDTHSQPGLSEASAAHAGPLFDAPSGSQQPSPLVFTASFASAPSEASHPTSPFATLAPSLGAVSRAASEAGPSLSQLPAQDSADFEATAAAAFPEASSAEQASHEPVGHTDSGVVSEEVYHSHLESDHASVTGETATSAANGAHQLLGHDPSTAVPPIESAYRDEQQHSTEQPPDPSQGDDPNQHPDGYPHVRAENDPHEISEGVYIDPPPPVLLALPMSERPDFSLFNRPLLSELGSGTLATEFPPEIADLPLLLEQRPTLYYESLSTVLETLRLQEHVMSAPGLDAEGELILDAYDLGVVISEDNVYAREVTLHELNVLHDAHRFGGPLRLRLRTVHPRFITRYHWLQDNIGRLHLGEEQVTNDSGYVHQEQGKIYHWTFCDSRVLTSFSEPHSTVDSSYEHAHELRQPAIDDSNQEEEAQNEGNAPNPADSDETVAAPDTEYQEGNNEEEDREEDQEPQPSAEADSASVVLDADAVHQAADTDAEAPVGNEQTEYEAITEPREDYHEEYPPLPDDDDDEQDLEDPVLDPDTVPANGVSLSEALEVPGDGVPEGSVAVTQNLEDSIAVHPESGDADNDTSAVTEAPTFEENYEALGGEAVDATETHETDNIEVPTTDEAPQTNSIPDLTEQDAAAVDQEFNAQSESYPDVEWDDNLDGEGESDSAWDPEQDTFSNESSVTLSSKASKRTLEEADLEEDGFEEIATSRPASPGTKRPRTQ
ncbi:hypothetical protein HGRIS_013442 [Hohenbuehelia grisea]|uniref:Uncharacterized protein n=1 Tax=Hohenbuehelia grisea TaxID=104357 RepID=A0ABR3IVP8_9AGAR